MVALALLYAVVLIAIVGIGVRSRYLPWSHALIAIFLLMWAIIIMTAHALSLFSAISVTSAYILLSIVIAVATAFMMRQIPLQRELSFPQFGGGLSPRIEGMLLWFLVATGTLAILTNMLLIYGLLPSNPDSIVYRFPRAYWYFGQGSLMHFTNHAEPRPLYYPFNGTLTYLPLIHFQLGPRWFSLHSVVSWLMIALTTYVFARDLGGTRFAAAATAWIGFLTPNVLIQSTSTNDEIVAAAPLLGGLFFLHRWFNGRQRFDFALAVIGIAISAGTKLHVMFYWPLLLAIAVFLAFRFRSVFEEARGWLNVRSMLLLTSLVLIGAILAASFIGYNFVSTGNATAWEFNAQLLNVPFSWGAAVQTAVLYAAQVVLTPFADLHIAFDSTVRANHYVAFNKLVQPMFWWVNNGPSYTSAFYRFTGVNSPSAVVFNEQTVFIGFTWLAALIAAAWLAATWRDARWTWGRLHLLSLPVWALAYAATTRYIEGFSVYLGYATIVATPALVYAFAPVQRISFDRFRWALLALVVATHCFFALNVFFTSSPRNLIVLKRAPVWPVSRGVTVDQAVQDEVARAQAGVVSHTIAWGQPHWVFMAYHPEIRQFLSRNPIPLPIPPGDKDDDVSQALRFSRYVLTPNPADPHLHVYSFPQFPAYGRSVPVRVPDKPSSGLTLIGDLMFALGPEWVFMAGNGVESRYPGRDRYLVLQFAEMSDFGRDPEPIVRITPTIYGLGPGDDLKFRFEIKVDGKSVAATDWSAVPRADLKTVGRKGDNTVMTVQVRNDGAGGRIYSTDVTLGSTKPLQLTP